MVSSHCRIYATVMLLQGIIILSIVPVPVLSVANAAAAMLLDEGERSLGARQSGWKQTRFFSLTTVPQESSQVPSVPSNVPSMEPTLSAPPTVSASPTTNPSVSAIPSSEPSDSLAPSSVPSSAPTMMPFVLSTPPPGQITYQPGNLTTLKDLLWLSEGLDSRLVARSGFPVEYGDGSGVSNATFHFLPDAAACFPDTRRDNLGGWIYVSNSEIRSEGQGGVGAVTFDKDGKVIDYYMLLEGTKSNCGGGKTPWGTWVSCEETAAGNIYQVDPTGVRPAEMMTLGSDIGWWESFAYDVRDEQAPCFFATEDQPNGALARFTPDMEAWANYSSTTNSSWSNSSDGGGLQWEILHGPGVIEYLILEPDRADVDSGTFSWTTNRMWAKLNALMYYPSTEGIDVNDNELYFVCKGIRMLYTLDLDSGNYTRASTQSGLFQGTPDQIKRIIQDENELMYFTEDDAKKAGVHARDSLGHYLTVLESPILLGETSGLAFSPDARIMYVTYQTMGRLYAIWRRDGLPFYGTQLDLKYHEQNNS